MKKSLKQVVFLSLILLLLSLTLFAFVKRQIPIRGRNLTQEANQALLKRGREEFSRNFYFQQLNQQEQNDYIRLVDGLRQFRTNLTMTTRHKQSLNRIYLSVMNDFPEFYWLSEMDGEIDLASYSYPDDVEAVYAQLQEIADAIVADLPDGSDYDKVNYLYQRVIDLADYDLEALTDDDLARSEQSIRSVFLTGWSVCAGYSRAFQFLCQKAGLDCIYVSGDVSVYDLPHAWNLVKIDGAYYPVDTTWGDPSFESEVVGQDLPTINYAYLCMPKTLFEENHQAWPTLLSEDTIALAYPDLASDGLNYHSLKQTYFQNEEEVTIFLQSILQETDQEVIAFQLASDQLYQAVLESINSDDAWLFQLRPDVTHYQVVSDGYSRQISIILSN